MFKENKSFVVNPNSTRVFEYWANKNKNLKDDYRDFDGSPEVCLLVAKDIAEILLQEGKRPSIVCFSRENDEDFNGLKPLPYNGKVKWGSHTVCLCEGLVYDPITEKPLPVKEYINKIFGHNVSIRVIFSEEELAKKTSV